MTLLAGWCYFAGFWVMVAVAARIVIVDGKLLRAERAKSQHWFDRASRTYYFDVVTDGERVARLAFRDGKLSSLDLTTMDPRIANATDAQLNRMLDGIFGRVRRSETWVSISADSPASVVSELIRQVGE